MSEPVSEVRFLSLSESVSEVPKNPLSVAADLCFQLSAILARTVWGSMYIGNIHWKHCRLETSFKIGNIDWILETKIGYWKHQRRLET